MQNSNPHALLVLLLRRPPCARESWCLLVRLPPWRDVIAERLALGVPNAGPSLGVPNAGPSSSLQKAGLLVRLPPWRDVTAEVLARGVPNACPSLGVPNAGPSLGVPNAGPSSSLQKAGLLVRLPPWRDVTAEVLARGVPNACPSLGVPNAGPSLGVPNAGPSSSLQKAGLLVRLPPWRDVTAELHAPGVSNAGPSYTKFPSILCSIERELRTPFDKHPPSWVGQTQVLLSGGRGHCPRRQPRFPSMAC